MNTFCQFAGKLQAPPWLSRNDESIFAMKTGDSLSIYVRRLWCLSLLFLAVSILSSCSDVNGDSANNYELNGYGTEDYPFLISSKDDFDCFRSIIANGDDARGKYYALACDVDLGGEILTPVADESSGRTFAGVFDGRGFCLSNYSIEPNGRGESSVFGRVDGTVKNLSLNGAVSGVVAASFATQGAGSIINCVSSCDVVGSRQACGIVANWEGSLAGVVFAGIAEAPTSVGISGGGTGSATNAYCYGLPLGELSSFETSSSISRGNEKAALDSLNEAARDWFLKGGIGIHVCLWVVGEDGLELSGDMAAFRGSGSQSDPYLIDSVQDLEALRYYLDKGYPFNEKCLIQTRDIDLAGTELCAYSPNAVAFLGEYYGDGHSIRNMTAPSADTGLFLHFDGEITSLGIVECNGAFNFGLFGDAGSKALISNSYVTGRSTNSVVVSELLVHKQLPNCYIDGLVEPTHAEMNAGLNDLVALYGVHCGVLYTWKEGISPAFDSCYFESYFNDERSHWQGSGVERDPYLVYDLSDLAYLRESVYYNESFWRYWFAQAADIDLSDVVRWKPISDLQSAYGFMGTYNGDGFCIIGYRQENAAISQDSSIFGRVRGTVMNVSLKECDVFGEGGAILASTITDTGKIMNNVVVLSDASTAGIISLVQVNSGQVLNNLISLPRSEVSAVISQSKATTQESDGIGEFSPIEKSNQIVSGLSNEAVAAFNDAVVPTALLVKQRIADFQTLSIQDGITSLHNPISLRSSESIEFAWRIACGNPLIIVAAAWILICIAGGCYFLVQIARRKKKLSWSTGLQVAIIAFLFLVFVLSIIVTRPGTTWAVAGKAVVVAAIVAFGVASIELIKRRSERRCFREKLAFLLRENRFLLLSFCITAVMAVMHFDIPIAYDSDLYYGSFIIAMENFNFSLPGFMDSFCIASKPMHGIAMLMAVGEALDPGTGRGVYIVNLVLLLIAQVCVYKTILTLFPKLSRTSSALLSLCFAFSAYVVTGVTYINPDFYSVVTFAIFVFLWLRKYKVMAAYFGFLMMCSKPNMIVAYLVMLLIRLIFEIKKKRFATLDWMLYTAPIAVYLLLYFGVDSLNRVGVAKPSDLDAVTVLGSRLLQYFTYGLVWLPEIAIIWAVIHSAKKRSIHVFGDEKQVLLFSVWVASMSQLLILIIGGNVLQPCPRYLAICAVKNVLLLAWAFDELPRFASLRRILIPAFTTLLAIQLFVTIDPTIIMTTACKYDGLHYLVCPPTKSVGNDLTFYNYEYAKDAKSGTAILNDLSAQEIENLYTEGRGNYKLAIGSSDVYAAYWDTERKCRTYIRNDNCIRLGSINVTNGLSPLREERLPQSTVILRSNAKSYLWSQLSGREGDEYGSFTVFKGVTDD